MKKLMLLSPVILTVVCLACSDSKGRYIDLSTGKAIEVSKDEKTGFMVNKETGEALYIYVDTKNHDTIYAKTGKVINGHIILGGESKYVFDEDEKVKTGDNGNVEYKDGDKKVEVENDGDIKIKDGDKKVKIDGETGERKTKSD